MPTDVRAWLVLVRVIPVAGFGGQIDPADEGDAIVDHDRLLVMAVERAFLVVERALDLRVPDQLVPHLAHVCPRWTEERQRRTCPRQHAHVEALGKLGEKIAQDERLVVTREREVRREVPARQMHVRVRLAELSGDRGQRLRAVDQDLDGVPGTHRRLPGRPAARRRVERAPPADPGQPSRVMAADLLADLPAEPALDREEGAPEQPQRLGVARSGYRRPPVARSRRLRRSAPVPCAQAAARSLCRRASGTRRQRS